MPRALLVEVMIEWHIYVILNYTRLDLDKKKKKYVKLKIIYIYVNLSL